MPIYTNQRDQLNQVKEKPFKLERDIQRLFEQNLDTVMGLSLVKSEFAIKGKRIDTLAYDEQANAFVIIEYKRDKNYSVVDQGFSYLSLMLENKADFILEYNEKNEKAKRTLKRHQVDWSQTRVAFVSPSFTTYQIQATHFKDIAIELWEVRQYQNGTISINQLKQSTSAPSVKPLARENTKTKEVADEIKVYTEDDHAENTSGELFELYKKYRNSILDLADDIEVRVLKSYISFRKNGVVASLLLQKSKLQIVVGTNVGIGALNDSRGIAKDVSQTGHLGPGHYSISVNSDQDLEYIMSLVKQAL